jgi:hypothetical protein
MLKGYAQSLYNSTATITQFQPEDGVINNTSAVVVAENIPCRVMYKSIPSTVEKGTGATLTQVIKLYLSPEVGVKAGSIVAVTTNGTETVYACAGEPAVYISHQEIELKLKDRWV